MLGEHRSFQEFYAQLSFVKTFRDLFGLSEDYPLPPLAGRFAIGRPGSTAPMRSRMTPSSSRWAAAICSAATA